MAMKFNQPEVTRIYQDAFKPAAQRAGFLLKSMLETQAAGLIDDRMRVLLRRARFVVADLTHDENYGAYWESGFAEGLGKPVIYTCEANHWEARKSHFDTNHLTTVIWETSSPSAAEQKLLDTIRATLPAVAKMID